MNLNGKGTKVNQQYVASIKTGSNVEIYIYVPPSKAINKTTVKQKQKNKVHKNSNTIMNY